MTRCQAITVKGTRCTRESLINIDLTKKRKINIPFTRGVKTPKYKCCFYCKQHVNKYLFYYMLYGINSFIKSRLTPEEWILNYPDDAVKFFKDYRNVSLSLVKSNLVNYVKKFFNL